MPAKKTNTRRMVGGGRISAREASRIAVNYFKKVATGQPSAIAVEEVEMTEDASEWLITLGFAGDDWVSRVFKVFRINAASGEVRSMKIRTP